MIVLSKQKKKEKPRNKNLGKPGNKSLKQKRNMKSEVQQKNEDYVKIKLDKCRKQYT